MIARERFILLCRAICPSWTPRLDWFRRLAGSRMRFPMCLWDACDLVYQARRVKWSWQRMRRGWSDRDALCPGLHTSCVAAGALTKHIAIDPRMWKRSEFSEEQWTAILKRMRDGFAAADHLTGGCSYECQGSDGHDAKYRAIWNEGMDLSKKWLLSVWD